MIAQFKTNDVLKWKEVTLEHRASLRYVVGEILELPLEVIYQVEVFDRGEFVGAGAFNHETHNKFVKTIASKGVYTAEDCLPNSSTLDFTGQIMVVPYEKFVYTQRIPENQLWRAMDGFGCHPELMGKAVFAKCLDGDEARWNRQDFLGVLKPELIPESHRPVGILKSKITSMAFVTVDYIEFQPETYKGIQVTTNGETITVYTGDFEKDYAAVVEKYAPFKISSSIDNFTADVIAAAIEKEKLNEK
jgi:hypothetical protein